MIYSGLIWWQDTKDADMIKKVFFVFNPQIYNIENLKKANDLIGYCLKLWYNHGISTEKERNSVENLERQYVNNNQRIYHFDKFYMRQIFKLTKKIEKLSLI
jgi:hypothetical protein